MLDIPTANTRVAASLFSYPMSFTTRPGMWLLVPIIPFVTSKEKIKHNVNIESLKIMVCFPETVQHDKFILR